MRKFDQVFWGGIIGDASSMGFHWLYDPDRIKAAGGDTPEFHDPDPSLYVGVSPFVHQGKKAGDITQYGDQLLVMLKALAKNKGVFSQAEYEKEFASFFGPGGRYVGYIDRPTEMVLYNLKKRERDAYANARTFDNGLSKVQKGVLEDKVMATFKLYDENKSKEQNIERLDEIVLISQDYKRDSEVDRKKIEYCKNMFNVVYDSKSDLCGDEGDDQFPAIVKFPPIVALYHDKENFPDIIDVVTRLTNNNDRSVSYGRVYAAMLATAIRTGDKDAVIEAAKESANSEIREIIDAALARIAEPNVDVTGYFGRSCHLPFGLPQNIHLISNCNTYVDAMRMNILAAGDNAGRGIMIGAIYAALYGVGGDQGVPQAWIDKVTIKQEIDELLSMIPSTPEPSC